MINSVARHYKLSKARAAQRYDDTPIAPEAANHRPLTAICNHGAAIDAVCDCPVEARLVIEQPGVWQEFAESFNHGDELRQMVAEGREVTWREILALMQVPGHSGGKTLILRPRIFAEEVGPSVLPDDDERVREARAAGTLADPVTFLSWPLGRETEVQLPAGPGQGDVHANPIVEQDRTADRALPDKLEMDTTTEDLGAADGGVATATPAPAHQKGNVSIPPLLKTEDEQAVPTPDSGADDLGQRLETVTSSDTAAAPTKRSKCTSERISKRSRRSTRQPQQAGHRTKVKRKQQSQAAKRSAREQRAGDGDDDSGHGAAEEKEDSPDPSATAEEEGSVARSLRPRRARPASYKMDVELDLGSDAASSEDDDDEEEAEDSAASSANEWQPAAASSSQDEGDDVSEGEQTDSPSTSASEEDNEEEEDGDARARQRQRQRRRKGQTNGAPATASGPASAPASAPALVSAAGEETVQRRTASPAPFNPSDKSTRVYDVNDHLVRLPPPADARLDEADVVALVNEALASLAEKEGIPLELSQLEAARAALRPLTMGGLKSALQKAIRFRSSYIALPAGLKSSCLAAEAQVGDSSPGADQRETQEERQPPPAGDTTATSEPVLIPAPAYAAMACAMLFAHAGGFIPDLQLFARGCTAAVKRLAVILLEDAWVDMPNTGERLQALLGLALALQELSDYHPSRDVMLAVVALAAHAAHSPYIINWRKEGANANSSAEYSKGSGVAPSPQPARVLTSLAVRPTPLRQAATLLRAARSFVGDYDMMNEVIHLATKGDGVVPVWVADDARAPTLGACTRAGTVPPCHAIDQHAFRGVAHVAGSQLGRTFPERFSRLFKGVTGVNPRLHNANDFEERPLVRAARFAQDIVYRFAIRKSLPHAEMVLPRLDAPAVVRLALDPGVLAAGVGPVPVSIGRKRLMVLLGVQVPEDEVVMVKPSRNARDLYGSLTDEERAKAIAEARSRLLKVRSPLLKGSPTAAFQAGRWCLDGRPWSDVVAEGIELTVPAHPPPAWGASRGVVDSPATLRLGNILRDDAALVDALWARGNGLVEGAPARIRALAAAVSPEVRLRAAATLRQQYERVALPVPSAQGKLAR